MIRMLLAILCLLAAFPAFATTPDNYCAGQVAPETAPGSTVEIKRAARSAEALLARRGAAGDLDKGIGALDVQGQGDSRPDVAALAEYCNAAGELMRVATTGSQYQAEKYLRSAVRYAVLAKADETAAVAAYRLSLASGGGSIAGSRGASRAARRAASDPAPVVDAARISDDACGELLQTSAQNDARRRIMFLALACASDRSRSANDQALVALAALKRSRLALATAEAMPQIAADMRTDAGDSAVSGLAAARAARTDNQRVQLLGRLIECAMDAGRADDPAVGGAMSAMRAAAEADPASLAFATALAGRIKLGRGDRAGAAADFQQAVFLESQLPQPLRLADWLLLLAQAEPARRDELVIEAYRALESVRPLLPVADPLTEESTFSLRMRPVFEAAVAVQFSHAGNDDLAAIGRSQEIIEAYRQAEVQSFLGVDCVPPRAPVRPADLRPGEILLYPILLADHIELLTAAGGQAGDSPHYRRIQVRQDGADREAVGRLVNEVVSSTGYGTDDAWKAPSRQLYDLLVKPIEQELGGNTTLIIVPDGPLRALPFAALLDAQDKFLVEKTGLSVAPALAYSQPGLDHGGRSLNVVAASLEREVTLSMGVFPKLPGTGAEARVAAGVDEAGVRPGRLIEDFREADLVAALSRGRADILHLATHAAFNGRSDRSFIVANGEAIPLTELRALILGNRRRGDELDLLVLSACETAVGDDQASMGLAGTAVQAGARSAIASLWQVSDAGTVALMKVFYDQYRQGASKSEALRRAQIALIRSGGDFADPGIWAAFTLLGGWR